MGLLNEPIISLEDKINYLNTTHTNYRTGQLLCVWNQWFVNTENGWVLSQPNVQLYQTHDVQVTLEGATTEQICNELKNRGFTVTLQA